MLSRFLEGVKILFFKLYFTLLDFSFKGFFFFCIIYENVMKKVNLFYYTPNIKDMMEWVVKSTNMLSLRLLQTCFKDKIAICQITCISETSLPFVHVLNRFVLACLQFWIVENRFLCTNDAKKFFEAYVKYNMQQRVDHL